ncbi:hypothetical protein CDO52_01765 [Nocardiopsis gilva YIM 90087]|uniref:TIGR02679 family protein n=1 Tax=Nocardiopsis gilva YIM 90087 TaxID=1235441 RepID=A0A223S0Z1_9ACTN|nr:TIGR02679 domain-containing protein [Nocardiopsis gilva]ASU81689.1 hypothetical protein CDO52_01765 [Nocardiopsis gilva YIM 90087]
MADPLPRALAEWADQPGPAKVINEVRKRALRNASTETGSLRCSLTPDERTQVGRLLGVQWVLSERPVRLRDLNAALAPHGHTARTVAEAVHGPIVPNSEKHRSQELRADKERDEARVILRAVDAPVSWLEDPWLPRPGDGELVGLIRQVAKVWEARPDIAEPRRLAVLAAHVCGDAHALDDRRQLGKAVARLAATVHDLDRPTRTGTAWRAAWKAIGVLCDEVSSCVLVLNLRLAGTASAVLQATASPGEPVWLSSRALGGDWKVAAPTPVFVCENPTVVEAAADRWGSSCHSMVCTNGIASTAALELVRGLAESGCPIYARADFDRTGFVIVDQVRSVAPAAHPWRFDAETYSRANPAHRLTDTPFTRESIQQPVHEEAILAFLLADLDGRGEPTR